MAMNKLHATYTSFMKSEHKRMIERIFSITVVIALLSTASYYGYQWYVVRREAAAQKVFADCMQEYMQASVGQERWAHVEQLCKLGYEQNSSSHLAPYFLGLQAEALLEQNKKNEARDIYTTMIKKLSPKAPTYGLYATKYALLLLDMADEAFMQQGVELLTKLAYDPANSSRDEALYYLGLYHWTHDAHELAKKAWQELENLVGNTTKQDVSPWAELAQSKLQSLS